MIVYVTFLEELNEKYLGVEDVQEKGSFVIIKTKQNTYWIKTSSIRSLLFSYD